MTPYRKKGALFSDLMKDKAAVEAVERLKRCVADKVPLVNPDYTAAGRYWETGRPFEIYIDASHFGWTAVVAQRAEPHAVPRPIAQIREVLKMQWY